MKRTNSRSTIYNDHKIPDMEVTAMIIFLAGLMMSEVTAILGMVFIFQGLRHGTISHELGILGMSGCFCYLVITISWLYLKLTNQE